MRKKRDIRRVDVAHRDPELAVVAHEAQVALFRPTRSIVNTATFDRFVSAPRHLRIGRMVDPKIRL